MILDLSDLKEIGTKLTLTKEIEIKEIEFREEKFEVEGPLKVDIDLIRTEDSFVFTGKLNGALRLKCSRCLKEFSHPIEVDINDELDLKDIEDLHHVNIFSILVSDIILEIPIKPLHDQDCKGLCPICGQDLNEEDCGCEVEDVDPRLAKLEEFKQKLK